MTRFCDFDQTLDREETSAMPDISVDKTSFDGSPTDHTVIQGIQEKQSRLLLSRKDGRIL